VRRATFRSDLPSKLVTSDLEAPVKRLSFFFFLVALLLAGVAIAAVVVRANGLLPETAVAATAQNSLSSN
jgi:hypothetical protein